MARPLSLLLLASAHWPLCAVAQATKLIALGGTSAGRFALQSVGVSVAFCDTPNASIATELHAIGASVIRTHDADVLDWCVLFPDPTRDPDDVTAWEFSAGDAYFATIVGAGFAPYFRLGGSWNVPSPACLSPDPGTFSRVAVNTVKRYNDNNFGPPGPWPKKSVAAWEIFNEPDGERFWNGTSADFFALFDRTARALKAYDATLLVGGPGVANTLAPSARPYAFGLLDAVAAAGTPIDFYSWHGYGTLARAPQSLYNDTISAVRVHLASVGLGGLRQHVTEWASAILGNETLLDSPLASAYVGAAMSYFALAGDVTLATFYPGCEGVVGLGDGSWGLFQDLGNGSVAWRGQGRAYAAVGHTLRATPFALPAAYAAEEDYVVLAGADAGTGARSVSVVVSAARSTAAAFELMAPLGGGGSRATVSVFLIDAAHPDGAWTLANASVPLVAGVATVTQPFVAPAVAWVTLES
jgi:hypothetical protein